MARAYEISVWKPHSGKRAEFLKRMKEWKEVSLRAGVSSYEILNGTAGKDVNHIVIIQGFKGLADNGAVNETFFGNAEVAELWKKWQHDLIADLVSHDLYEEEA
jgi:hypothetical protein